MNNDKRYEFDDLLERAGDANDMTSPSLWIWWMIWLTHFAASRNASGSWSLILKMALGLIGRHGQSWKP